MHTFRLLCPFALRGTLVGQQRWAGERRAQESTQPIPHLPVLIVVTALEELLKAACQSISWQLHCRLRARQRSQSASPCLGKYRLSKVKALAQHLC